ncbi:MAG TPA: phosphatase PAP2 family protein [Nitrospiria bacterium]|nr:phosphatase PAP2 family protein [Nitrospiria bacterium]
MSRRDILLVSSISILVVIPLFLLDQTIRILISSIRTDQVMNIMGLIGDIGSWAYLSLVAAALLGFSNTRKNEKLKIAGGYGLVSILVSRFIVEVMKHLAGRPRPSVFDSEGLRIGPTFAFGYDAFPSGHAASSIAFAYILSRSFPDGRYAFYAGGILISFSRIYLDVHYASDIYAGGLIGLFSGMIIYKYLESKRTQGTTQFQ